jgi:hypothetical protein
MKTYTILYAEDVPHYGTREIEVGDDSLAIARAINIRPDAMSKYTNDPDHRNPQCRRIVHIEGPDGVIAEAVYLDIADRLRAFGPELADALADAIRAMNATPSFDTGLPDPDNPKRTLSSYRLLPRLEAVLRNARGQS